MTNTQRNGPGGRERVVLVLAIGVAIGLAAFCAATVPISPQLADWRAIGFWLLIVAFSSALPVRMPSGSIVSVVIGPIVAVAALGGPTAAVIVAAIGTLELRELKGLIPGRGGVPWYGTLFNHAEAVIPAAAAGAICVALAGNFEPSAWTLIVVVAAGVTYFVVNNFLAAIAVSARDGAPLVSTFRGNAREFGVSLAGLAPVAWLMAAMWIVAGPIGVLPFAVPLFATRVGLQEDRRDPRHVHPDRAQSGRRRRRQGPLHGRSLGARPAASPRTWARSCAAQSLSWRPSSGAACCTTSARSASPTRSCSSRAP